MKNKTIKIFCLLILLALISTNIYFSKTKSDPLTKLKLQYFSFDGSSRFLGQLNLWYWFANQNDWNNAAKFESSLDQIHFFKSNNQPQELAQRINEIQSKENKDAQDYLLLAKIQTSLGLNQEAVYSITKAHQIDPIRPDLDQLFYSVTN
ncbi:hypothetical protein SDC9_77045 [bioreactor metagenome]|uniref:Uncharacterized protein n=1 Tax=bioreactor metagenome TaxID=1076179 RepID=A0A644YPH5_9ZZZZ